MSVHESNACIDIVHHLPEGIVMHKLTGSGRIEPSRCRVEVCVVVQVGAHVVCKLLQSGLLRD